MVAAAGSVDAEVLVRRRGDRFGYAILAANFVGGLVVFLFGNYVLPNPPDLHHTKLLLDLNLIVFAVGSAIALPLGWIWSRRRWRATLAWSSRVAIRPTSSANRRSVFRSASR